MQTDRIASLGIDDDGALWVRPATTTFPYIYREAKGVEWDAEQRRLRSPKPREWSYVDWFVRIKDAAREQGVELAVEGATSWSNVPADLRRAICERVDKP